MNRLESLVQAAIGNAINGLKGRVSQEEGIEIGESLHHLHLPGFMALLALGKRAASGKKEKETGNDKIRVGGLQTDDIKEKALRAALNKVAKERGLPVDSEQIQKAWKLLSTREFFEDVASGTAAVIHLTPNLPVSIIKDVRKAPKLPFAVITGAAKDMVGSMDSLPDVLEDLEDGELNETPKVMSNTLRALFQHNQSLTSIIETLRTLIDRENESVRLAIIIYARSQGVNIEEGDIDAVHQALDPENPDLGPVVLAGVDYLEREYGLKRAKKIVRRLSQDRAPGILS